MTISEYIKKHEDVLRVCLDNEITPADITMVAVVDAYHDMRARGFKSTFAVEYLASRNGASVSSLWRAINKFSKNIAL